MGGWESYRTICRELGHPVGVKYRYLAPDYYMSDAEFRQFCILVNVLKQDVHSAILTITNRGKP